MKAADLLKRLGQFQDWLRAAGAEVLEPTNEWEVVRFRAAGVTSVIYRNGKGHLTMGKEAEKALDSFEHGKPWSAGVATARRRYSTDERSLLRRDGCGCFLCWEPLGDDITVEHLVPVNAGGTNHLANKALAHSHCNSKMGHLSLMEKVRMREANKPRPREFIAYHQAMGLMA